MYYTFDEKNHILLLVITIIKLLVTNISAIMAILFFSVYI